MSDEEDAPVSMMALTAADEERRKGLRRMRITAGSLLVAAAVVYILTLHRDGVWGYVNAMAEAGMVGGLADWFAVTALFRHPLGIPVPHTALVPRKKDVFAKSLEDFVTGHFLTGEAARQRYLDADTIARLGAWLEQPKNAQRLTIEVSKAGRRALNRFEDSDMRYLVEHSMVPRFAAEPISPMAGALLQEVVADGVHRHLVDLVVIEGHDWLLDNPEQFMGIVGEKVPHWAPNWLGELVTDRLHIEALRWVRAVRDDQDHRVRQAIDALLRDLAMNLQEDPQTMARTEALKERLLAHPQTADTAMLLWGIGKDALLRALDDPSGMLRTRLEREFIDLGGRMQHDEVLRKVVNDRVGDALEYLVNTYGGELAPVISQVIARWDGKEAAQQIELYVGRDLQFIRINGTVVGALAGLIIHALSQLAA